MGEVVKFFVLNIIMVFFDKCMLINFLYYIIFIIRVDVRLLKLILIIFKFKLELFDYFVIYENCFI